MSMGNLENVALRVAKEECGVELLECIVEKTKGDEPSTLEIASIVSSWLVADIDSVEFEKTEILVDKVLQDYVELESSKFKSILKHSQQRN